ncbi:MAG TPA: hypothetical protein VG269_26965 [Tepidisphaeraceae bacterium]|jgi:hypothetical protein|nr:hypothetical protein [Tepidisphaeraceae bacterium]
MCWKFWHKYPPPSKIQPVEEWHSVESFKNLPVLQLIAFSCSDDRKNCFIIFLNHNEDVDYATTGECDQKITNEKCGKTVSRIATLEVVPIQHLSRKTRLDFRAMLAEGLARAMHDDHANAKAILDAANQFVAARNQETGRRWLLQAAELATLMALSAAGFLWLGREGLTVKWGVQFIPVVTGCAAGATGALFSLLTRVAKIPLDPAAGRGQHYLEGAGHILAGMIGAVFVYLAMKAGLFAPKLLEVGLGGQALGCMIGGASERLVPTIIKKVDVTKADTAK